MIYDNTLYGLSGNNWEEDVLKSLIYKSDGLSGRSRDLDSRSGLLFERTFSSGQSRDLDSNVRRPECRFSHPVVHGTGTQEPIRIKTGYVGFVLPFCLRAKLGSV